MISNVLAAVTRWRALKSRPHRDLTKHQLQLITPTFLQRTLADPKTLADAFKSAEGELRMLLPRTWRELTRAEMCFVFASTVAHNAKPYGPGTTADLDAMLTAKTLDCSNYGLLAHHLAVACDVSLERARIAFVGWDGGRIGSHQMLFMSDLDRSESDRPHLILDPTVGLVARSTFNALASGHPLLPENVLAINATDQLNDSRLHIYEALASGAFRPSDILYYFESIEHLLTGYGHPETWPTPGAEAWRRRARSKDGT
jgi:hypothetical protein